jgi:nucleoside-diphosphate-sugar epimerase
VGLVYWALAPNFLGTTIFGLQNEVIKPTINGLLGIMKACVKAKTVRRLVFTSSAGTVNVEEHQKPVYDESCWSDVEFCRTKKMTGWVRQQLFYLFFSFFSLL